MRHPKCWQHRRGFLWVFICVLVTHSIKAQSFPRGADSRIKILGEWTFPGIISDITFRKNSLNTYVIDKVLAGDSIFSIREDQDIEYYRKQPCRDAVDKPLLITAISPDLSTAIGEFDCGFECWGSIILDLVSGECLNAGQPWAVFSEKGFASVSHMGVTKLILLQFQRRTTAHGRLHRKHQKPPRWICGKKQ